MECGDKVAALDSRGAGRGAQLATQGFALIFAHIFWGLGFSPRMGAFEP